MTALPLASPHTTTLRRRAAIVAVAASVVAVLLGQAVPAGAAQPRVALGAADSFAVPPGSTVTNTGRTTVSGDVGVSPDLTTPGLTGAMVTDGTIHRGDALAASAQADLTTAYDSAAGRTPATAVPTELGGQQLTGGVYTSPTLAITGTLTLDAQGVPSTVFVFRTEALTAGTSSRVVLTNGADACNVFWQVGSSATLGTDASFVGSLMALTSITAKTGADVRGRLLARNGAVTLDSNDIVRPSCATVPGDGGSSAPSSGSASSTPASSTPASSASGAGSSGAGSSGAGSSNPASSDAPTLDDLASPTGPQAGDTAPVTDGSGSTVSSASTTTTATATTTLATTGTEDLDLLTGAGALLGLGLLTLVAARRPTRGRHSH